MKRTLVAIAIAPLWAAAFAAVYAGLFFPVSDPILGQLGRGQRMAMGAVIGLALGYAAMVLIGLPAHALLRRRVATSTYALVWFALALVLWAVVHVAGFLGYGPGYAIAYLFETIVERPVVPLSFGLCWALVAVTFRVLVDRSPGATSAPPPPQDHP
ncbi:hypothetical protein [Luteimonas sp. FCS-9]|uniref:hypothetical protein n=1 Tax=Luteimonas sp. FCS-9 TaxID=1547516 RepID=UPI00063E70A2|nr:hypothetical protein [Luteimonas sp. FCS-9]KLJ01075.1 hypothetical protein WQ56_07570 [Luteimonas sp. FCS-9]